MPFLPRENQIVGLPDGSQTIREVTLRLGRVHTT